VAGSSTAPPPPLTELVTAYVRGSGLLPAVALRTVRTRVAFTGADHAPLGEVVDDEVAVLEGRHVTARFREVEVETHDDALAGAAIARLRAAGAGETILTPKYLRALGTRGLEPPELSSRTTLPDDVSVRDAVGNALATSVIRLMRADAGVRLDEDPERVHDARVAVRRLRSDLRTFRSLLRPGWASPLRRELAWLGDALRDVRDLDVLGERLAVTAPAVLGPADQEEGQRLIDRARAERSAAVDRLRADLGSMRYRELLDDLVEAAAQPGVAPEVAARPASEVMEPLMAGPWSHLERACRRIRRDAPDEDLHAARIRAKRARYAAEALAPVVGVPARKFSRAAGDLQDVLGRHQDAVMTARWLREAARAAPGAGFAAGLLAAREERERRRARESWPEAWKALRRRKRRSWP
jgi:CHAD domain-containing protein